MTAKQEQAIWRHGQQLQAIFPATAELDPISLCRRVWRIEREANAAATAHCNGEINGEDWECEAIRLLDKLDRVLQFRPLAIPVFINGDPRGYALKIPDTWMREHRAKLHQDWGGYGIIAPEIGKNGQD